MIEKKILILEDIKSGHAVQARAIGKEFEELSKELSPDYAIRTEYVEVEFKNHLAAILCFALSFFYFPFASSRLYFLKWFLKLSSFKKIKNIYADIVVSCGSKLIPLALWLSREHSAKTVVIMKPPFPYQLTRFDLVILPKHDKSKSLVSYHMVTAIAPNLSNEENLDHYRKKLETYLPMNGKQKLSVFIGGVSKAYRFDRVQFEKWLDTLNQAVQKNDLEFLLTTSRRTEPEIDSLIKNKISKNPNCKLLVIANEKNIEGITYGMLSVSDMVTVTEDSVSMISEAIGAGKRVVVLKIGNQKLPEKHLRFQSLLEKEGLIQIATADDFCSKLEAAYRMNPNTNFVKSERRKIREELRKILV